MDLGRLLFAVFLITPLIEIALFIVLGQTIGLWPTLLGVVVTALIGSIIIRIQGLSLIAEIRRIMNAGALPGRQIAEGVMLAVAGALLMTPGYFTDTCGFLLLVPAIRGLVYEFLAARVQIVTTSTGRQTRPNIDEDVVDLDSDDWRGR